MANFRRTRCLDSGCTAHLCQDTEDFTKIEEIKSGRLNLASSASTDIKAKGSVSITAEFNGKTKHVNLKDALHVPDLRTHLLSVGKITDEGLKVIFNKESATIIDKHGNDILKADRVNGLYYLQERNLECNSSTKAHIEENGSKIVSTENWHRKMGHLNIRDLIESDKNGSVQGMRIDTSKRNCDCDICIQGERTKTSFPKKSKKKTRIC